MAISDKDKYKLLLLLKDGFCQEKVSERLRMPKSTIHYHVHKCIKKGYVIEIRNSEGNRTTPILYSLTNEGESYLKLLNSTFSEGVSKTPSKPNIPRYILHHTQLKYPIFKDAPIYMSVEVQMKNWVKQFDEYKYCTAQKNGSSSMIFHIKTITGDDPYELELRARKIADQMATYFEGSFGMQLGRPTQIGKTHILDLHEDYVWERYKDYVHIETPVAIIDKTPPKGSEFKSVESAVNHANTGDNLVNLMNGFNTFVQRTAQDHTNQLNVLTDIRDLLSKFIDSQEYRPPSDKERKEIQ